MKPSPLSPATGQASVRADPRPAVAGPTAAHGGIEHPGRIVAGTRGTIRTLETSDAPSHHAPLVPVADGRRRRAGSGCCCEWKGDAIDRNVVIGDIALPCVNRSRSNPTAPSAAIRDHVAFYAATLDRRPVDGQVVIAQSDGVHGDWMIARVAGPCNAIPGSHGWRAR